MSNNNAIFTRVLCYFIIKIQCIHIHWIDGFLASYIGTPGTHAHIHSMRILVDRTARKIVSSVRPCATLCIVVMIHVHHTPKVSEQVNGKFHLGTRTQFYNFQPLHRLWSLKLHCSWTIQMLLQPGE